MRGVRTVAVAAVAALAGLTGVALTDAPVLGDGHPVDAAIRSTMVTAMNAAGVTSNPPVSVEFVGAGWYEYYLDGEDWVGECQPYQWATVQISAFSDDVRLDDSGFDTTLGGVPARRSYSQATDNCIIDYNDDGTANQVQLTYYDEEVHFNVGTNFGVRTIHRGAEMPPDSRLPLAVLDAARANGLDEWSAGDPITLVASADGYGDAFAQVDNDQLAADLTVTGEVVATDGSPVDGATIAVADGPATATPVTSGADGAFTINLVSTDADASGTDVADIRFELVAITGGISIEVDAEGYEPGTALVVPAESLAGGLPAQVVVVGEVYDAATDAPVAEARVSLVGAATAGPVTTGADGRYSLTASLGGAAPDLVVDPLDLPLTSLPPGEISVATDPSTILADGVSTTTVTVTMWDDDGNPLSGRTVVLGSPDGGTFAPSEVVTGADGTATATYTSFRPAPRPAGSLGEALIDVTISAVDPVDGIEGSGFVTLQQHLVTVTFDRAVAPSCVNCTVPVRVGLVATRYDFTPLAGVELTVGLPAGHAGVLATDQTFGSPATELTVTTDGAGRAEAWYRWTGDRVVRQDEAVVTAVESETNAAGSSTLAIEGFDLAIVGLETGGRPSEVTFDGVYLKIYVADQMWPTKSLERFDDGSAPVELVLRTWQLMSEGPLTSPPTTLPVRLATDARGTYVELFTTPSLPSVVPVNDGTTVFAVHVDARDAAGFAIADGFPPNNETTFSVDTTSPSGVVTTWLEDGILTPHNYSLAAAKCIIRFLPGWGTAVDLVDTTNAVMVGKWFDAGRSGLVNGSDKVLDLLGRISPEAAAEAMDSAAGNVNNVASCIEDFHRISTEGGGLFAGGPSAMRAHPAQADDVEAHLATVRAIEDRYLHGVTSMLTGYRAVVVYGDSEQVSLLDAAGEAVTAPRASHHAGVAVFLVPVHDAYRLELGPGAAADVAVYDTAVDPGHRTTHHYSAVGFDLATLDLPPGAAGEFEVTVADAVHSVEAATTVLDIVSPTIEWFSPPAGGAVGRDVVVSATYADGDGGSGIDPAGVRLVIDGDDVEVDAGAGSLTHTWRDAADGEHTAVLIVPDADGNADAVRWSFTVSAAGAPGGESGDGATTGELVFGAAAAAAALAGLIAIARAVSGSSGWTVTTAIVVLVGGAAVGAWWFGRDEAGVSSPSTSTSVVSADDALDEVPLMADVLDDDLFADQP